MARARDSGTRRTRAEAGAPTVLPGAGKAYRVPRGRLGEFARVIERDKKGRVLRGADFVVVVKGDRRGGRGGIQKAIEDEMLKPIARTRVIPGAGTQARAKPTGKRISAEAFEPGAKARALLRGVEIAERDLHAAGGTYELGEVERLLNISRQAIDKRVKEGALLAVPGPGNRRRYPAVQFTRGGTLPGLRDALTALAGRNPWYQLNWLVNPDPRFGGRTPAQLLEAGDVQTVVAAAKAQGEQGG